jgi:ABC-2 type transport system ATP-binding protein
MLACRLKPTSGTAIIAGFDLARQPAEIRRRVGLAPQNPVLYPALSARANLRFFGRARGLPGEIWSQRLDEALKAMGAHERSYDTAEEYLNDLKRRLNVAAALLHQPEILCLDEPTAGIDPQSRNRILDQVEALNRDGLTVLYATHYGEETERLCHRVALIDQGQIVALDTPLALQQTLGGGLIVIGLPDDVPGSLTPRLRALPDVLEVSCFGHQIKVKAGHAQPTLPLMIDIFNELGINIRSLEVLEPNLESVFLELTGRRLRD